MSKLADATIGLLDLSTMETVWEVHGREYDRLSHSLWHGLQTKDRFPVVVTTIPVNRQQEWVSFHSIYTGHYWGGKLRPMKSSTTFKCILTSDFLSYAKLHGIFVPNAVWTWNRFLDSYAKEYKDLEKRNDHWYHNLNLIAYRYKE